MSTLNWPQPYENIQGTDLSGNWLLSLDEKAIAHRDVIIVMGKHLLTATLVGNPAPVVRRMSDRMRQPERGDIAAATEVLHGRGDLDYRIKGLGVFLGQRREWAETDADWEAFKAEDGCGLTDEDRTTDTVFYLQYGPAPGDICRWHNSEPVALLTQPWSYAQDGAASREETPDGRQRAVFTRDSLIGALADSGFELRIPPGDPDKH